MLLISFEVVLRCRNCGLELFTKIRPQDFKKKDVRKCSKCKSWMEPWRIICREYFPEPEWMTKEKMKSFIALKDLFGIYINLDDFGKEK